MTDLRVPREALDEGLRDDIHRIAERIIDTLNGSSEWPALKYNNAVDGAAEALEEFIMELTVESLADSIHDAFLNELRQVA